MSTEIKHTKGPWKAVKMEKPIGGCTHEIQYGTDGEVICEMVYGEHDAKLIASAPALLEALQECRDTLVMCSLIDKSDASNNSIAIAEAAIKQATE